MIVKYLMQKNHSLMTVYQKRIANGSNRGIDRGKGGMASMDSSIMMISVSSFVDTSYGVAI